MNEPCRLNPTKPTWQTSWHLPLAIHMLLEMSLIGYLIILSDARYCSVLKA